MGVKRIPLGLSDDEIIARHNEELRILASRCPKASQHTAAWHADLLARLSRQLLEYPKHVEDRGRMALHRQLVEQAKAAGTLASKADMAQKVELLENTLRGLTAEPAEPSGDEETH